VNSTRGLKSVSLTLAVLPRCGACSHCTSRENQHHVFQVEPRRIFSHILSHARFMEKPLPEGKRRLHWDDLLTVDTFLVNSFQGHWVDRTIRISTGPWLC